MMPKAPYLSVWCHRLESSRQILYVDNKQGDSGVTGPFMYLIFLFLVTPGFASSPWWSSWRFIHLWLERWGSTWQKKTLMWYELFSAHDSTTFNV
jgi:hypothetical protein